MQLASSEAVAINERGCEERDNGDANSDQSAILPSQICVEHIKPSRRFSPVCLSAEDKSRKRCQCTDDDPAEAFQLPPLIFSHTADGGSGRRSVKEEEVHPLREEEDEEF